MKNMSKWRSYQLAYDHITAAIEQGFSLRLWRWRKASFRTVWIRQ